jgi:hypothetical protein
VVGGYKKDMILKKVLAMAKLSWCAWMALSLGVVGIFCTSWEFYFVIFPTILLKYMFED